MKEIIDQFGQTQKELIYVLHRIQAEYGYIPEEAIALISKRLKITESEVYGVLTFYKAFRIRPLGKHVVTVCAGTACHVRGGHGIAQEMERILQIKPGETTPDREFSLETVNCFGCCAIGPMVVVDGQYFSHVTLGNIEGILRKFQTAS